MIRNHVLLIAAFFFAGCASTQNRDQIDKSKTEPPKLLKPVVRKIWIPPEIRNGGAEWVEGHYMYRIEKETTWSR